MAEIEKVITTISGLLEKEDHKTALRVIEGMGPSITLPLSALDKVSANGDGKLWLLAARVYYHNRIHDKAGKLIAGLEKWYPDITAEKDFISLKYQLLLKKKDPGIAIRYLESLSADIQSGEMGFFIRFCVGKACFWKGDYHASNIHFQACRKYYRSEADNLMLGNVLYMLGYTAFQRSFFEIAETYYNKALENFKVIGNRNKMAATQHIIGVLDYKTGRYSLAEKNLLAAAKYYNESGNKIRMAESYIARGRVCIFIGNLSKGNELIGKGLSIAEKTGYKRGVALACKFLGEISYLKGKIEGAFLLLEKARQIALDIAPNGDIMLEVSRRLGELNVNAGRLEDAEKALLKSLKLAEDLHDRHELGATLRSFGILEARRGNFDVARSYFKEAVTIFRLIKEQFELAKTLQTAAESFLEHISGIDITDMHDGVMELVREGKSCAGEASQVFDSLELKVKEHECSDIANRLNGMLRGRAGASKTNKLLFEKHWLYGGFLVAGSSHLKKVVEKVKTIATSSIPILITGETGTGKEVIARFIHKLSGRPEADFVAVNCASVADQVFESELFGHRKGAFTGALRDHAGLVMRASGGTLFLDEISELSVRQQAKLLRVLQEGKIRRVGESIERDVDVRIISASNQDPTGLLRSGKLRKDFYYRIIVESIVLEPLRKHRDDIYPLFSYYMNEFGCSSAVEEDVLRLLDGYNWPGNVRQLVSLAKVLALRCRNRAIIRKSDLPVKIRKHYIFKTDYEMFSDMQLLKIRSIPAIGLTKDPEDVKRLLISTLLKTGGNKSAAARELGISRSTIYRAMEKFDLT
ncbi:sigma 54-interacting transcriptional regulator [bacterium]|nr:sigma 54-interacting transcriptional regulator [bacterium]